MESKHRIICPECREMKSKTRQHRLRRSNGAILNSRNKKIECKDCQNFFDNTTQEQVDEMINVKNHVENKRFDRGEKTYYVENYSYIIPAGGSVIVDTGSQVQSGYAECESGPLSKTGSPISLTFVGGAKPNKDKIQIKNNSINDEKVFFSTIVDRQSK